MFLRIILGWAACFAVMSMSAQYGDLGQATQPADSSLVDDLIDYGELFDMSGGYAVGDTVMNFTVYDFSGQAFNLYDALQGEKPVVVVSGSVSCLRFRNTFEIGNNSQEYLAARTFMDNYNDQFNWVFVYGIEAHPTDGNCPSNCPTTVSNDTTVVQAPDYFYRRWALETWLESSEHEFPFNMYADNPDNAVYNTYFKRPYGMVALNCDGTVALRADWVNSFMMDSSNQEDLLALAEMWTGCGVDWAPDDTGNGNEDPDDDNTDDTDDDDNEPVIQVDSHALSDSGYENNATSIQEQSSDLIIYPNPASTRLWITWNGGGLLHYTLRTTAGTLVAQAQISSNIEAIDLSSLADGVYLIEVVDEHLRIKRERIVIKH